MRNELEKSATAATGDFDVMATIRKGYSLSLDFLALASGARGLNEGHVFIIPYSLGVRLSR